jgi:hypothetical protein
VRGTASGTDRVADALEDVQAIGELVADVLDGIAELSDLDAECLCLVGLEVRRIIGRINYLGRSFRHDRLETQFLSNEFALAT